MRKNWTPASGDLIFLDFDPQAGHEQAGRRPVLVLSDAAYNGKTGLAIVCPVTSHVKGYPFEVPLSSETGTAIEIKGVVLADQVKSVDWKVRKAKRGGRASLGVTDAVKHYLILLLNLRFQ